MNTAAAIRSTCPRTEMTRIERAAAEEIRVTLDRLRSGLGWLCNEQHASVRGPYEVANAVHQMVNAANPYTIPGAIVPSGVSTGRVLVHFEDGTVLDFG